jgi:hypothetical protein
LRPWATLRRGRGRCKAGHALPSQAYIGETEVLTTKGLILMFSKRTIQDTQIMVVIATLLAIVGQTVLLLPTAQRTAWSILGDSTPQIPITWADKPIIIGFVFATPLYCIVATSFFQVKRRLYPLVIHLGTFIAFAFITMDAVLRVSIGPSSTLWRSHVPDIITTTFTPFLLYLVVLGLVQTYIVNRVVRLNPPDEPLDQITYSINAPKDAVVHIIENSYIDGLTILDEIAPDTYEIRKRGAKFLTLVVASASRNRTLLSTVPYEFTVDSMTRTKATSEIRNSLANDLEKRLSEYLERNIQLRAVPQLDDEASKQALHVALRRTRSMLSALSGSWKDIPRLHKFATVILVVILAVTVGFYFADLVTDLGTIWSIIVLDALGLLLELGLPIREELSRRRKEFRLLSP